MSEGIIREGDSIEQIVEDICKEYNIGEESIEYEVIQAARKGFLGIGAKKAQARIKINVEEVLENKKRPIVDKSKEAEEILGEILRLANLESQIKTRFQDNRIYMDIQSEGSGILIGKQGKTLDAFQYIVNKIVARKLGDEYKVYLDTENYREKRKASLRDMAKRLSEKARKLGKPVSLKQMNPKERRIIHMALKEEKDVMTKSVGKGENKKLIIFPNGEKRQGDNKHGQGNKNRKK